MFSAEHFLLAHSRLTRVGHMCRVALFIARAVSCSDFRFSSASGFCVHTFLRVLEESILDKNIITKKCMFSGDLKMHKRDRLKLLEWLKLMLVSSFTCLLRLLLATLASSVLSRASGHNFRASAMERRPARAWATFPLLLRPHTRTLLHSPRHRLFSSLSSLLISL